MRRELVRVGTILSLISCVHVCVYATPEGGVSRPDIESAVRGRAHKHGRRYSADASLLQHSLDISLIMVTTAWALARVPAAMWTSSLPTAAHA